VATGGNHEAAGGGTGVGWAAVLLLFKFGIVGGGVASMPILYKNLDRTC